MYGPSVTTDTDPGFAQFGLDPRLLAAIASLGFETPTPIQRQAIPLLCGGADLVGGARTGSGKTAAFGLPLLHRVREGGPVRALVLAPTRELAIQVTDALSAMAASLPVGVLTIYGGASYQKQLRGLKRGATVVVGTPGRVIDLMDRGALVLDSVEYFVLDEADEMLRMGFVEDVERVFAALPKSRQVALFSATMPEPIRRVVSTYAPSAVEVQVEEEALSVGHIEQRYVRATFRQKDKALLRLLAGMRTDGTLIFARTRKRCADVADMLIRNGINADALHGDLNQGARERVLGRLRAKALDVVVATDVAARGLDVDHLTHVINYDMPDDVQSYTHRIGRTARAGRTGMAITLMEPRDNRRRIQFERDLGAKIAEMPLPSHADIARARRLQLTDLIADELRTPTIVASRDWVREVMQARGWSAENVAAAAVQLLSGELNFEVTDDATTDAPVRYDAINEVEIVISLGRRDGIRPADIVGSFTNDLGMQASVIGRISMGSHRTFVGLPAAIASAMLQAHSTIQLRGRDASVSLNQKRDAPARHPATKSVTSSQEPKRSAATKRKPKRKQKAKKKTRARRKKKT